MSMLVFSPIFPFLSVLGGGVMGIIAGSLLAIIFVATYYHSAPLQLIAKAAGGLFIIAAGVLLSFIIFRAMAGLPDFNLARSMSHMYTELVSDRTGYLLWGIVFGFVSIVAIFLAGLANSSSGGARRKLDHGFMPSWR